MALLTPAQLEQLRQIIEDASVAVAISTVGHEVTDVELQRLVDGGWIDPDAVDDVVLMGFQYGNLLSRLPAAANMSLTQFGRHLAANPIKLSEAERHAVKIAQDRAGQYCVGLGSRYNDLAGRMVIAADAKLASQTREIIREEVSRKVVTRETRRQLASNLANLTEDWARDWRRIASTETHMATQEGYLEDVRERFGEDELLAKIPEPTACPECKRLYLDEDGQPIARSASWWAKQGVSNAGRKKADWLPVLGAMHPWCQCRLIRVPAGWRLKGEFPAWDLVPGTVAEDVEKSRKLQGRRTFQGFEISIENRKGSVRHWHDAATDTDGETKMELPYGYIRMTEGMDGDHVDVFLGPDESAASAYVVHQMKAPSFTEPDEDKVLLGFKTAEDAKAAYLKHFDNPKFFGSMTTLPLEEFRSKVYRMKHRMIKARRNQPQSLELPFAKASADHVTRITGTVETMGQHDRGAARTAGENVRDDPQKVHEDWPPRRDRRSRKKPRKVIHAAEASDPELAGVSLDALVAAAERFDVRGLRAASGWANPPNLDAVDSLQDPVERTDAGRKNLEAIMEQKRQRIRTAAGQVLTLNPALIRREQKR